MKKALLSFICGGLLFSAYGQEPSYQPYRMTLEDCLQYAMGNNYNRQSVVLNEEVAQDMYDQSKMERLPSLSASLSENVTNTNNGSAAAWNGSYNLSTSVTLYQGGSISESIKQNKLEQEQTQLQTAQYDNELTINILQAFLTALGNEELLNYQQVVLESSEEQVRQGEQFYNVRKILESDYLLLVAQLASDRNNIVETTISRDNSLLALKSLMSMDPRQPLEIIYPDTSVVRSLLSLPDEDYVVERSIESLPDIQISNYDVEIAQSGLKISKSSFAPTLKLNGSVGTGHSQNFKNYGDQISDRLNEQAGLSLSVPIFSNNRTKSQVNQSRIALQKAELANKQTELDTRQNIIQEYRNVVSSGSKFRASEVKQYAYLKSFEAYRSKYTEGAITTVDLLQQQNNYINAMNDYIQSKYGFLLRRKVLDVYMGENITM